MVQTEQPVSHERKQQLSMTFLSRKIKEKGWLGCCKAVLTKAARFLVRGLGTLLSGFNLFAHVGRIANRYRFTGDPRLKSRHVLAWAFYPGMLRLVRKTLFRKTQNDEEYARTGVKQGVLPASVLSGLRKAIDGCPIGGITLDDYNPGYVHNSGLRDYEKALNSDHKFIVMNDCPREPLLETIKALAKPVAACLRSPWRVVNIRSWKSLAGKAETGPNSWHYDFFPTTALKLMIYLTGAGKAIGTTEIQLADGCKKTIEGPEGTWLLFNNGSLLHRGIAPSSGTRIIVEITICPALSQDCQPVFAGLNSAYPYYPWSRARGA